jgi:peptidoglycan/LPS O-acetylase OafA/YrhL
LTNPGAGRRPEGGKLYFPNLNGLRAIGAGIVMIGHVEFIKSTWNMSSYSWFPIPGKIGVTLFFALSGFLITSLLLQELSTRHTVQLKKFYLRRIFRIWPLYYLVVTLGLILFNHFDLLKPPGIPAVHDHLNLTNLLILIFLLPNITHFYIPYADQRWSIVVEEQFYLMQPFLVRVLKKRKRLIIAFLVIIFSPEIWSGLMRMVHAGTWVSPNVLEALGLQLKYLACIAVGCLFSVLFFKTENKTENKWEKIIFTRVFQWGVLGCLVACIGAGFYIYHSDELIDFRIYSLLFSIVVLNASQNPLTLFRLERPALDFLGKISYGIYMYHPVCIGLSLALVRMVAWPGTAIQNIVLYLLSIALTILVSWLSFTYFEGFFLRLKSRWESSRKGR